MDQMQVQDGIEASAPNDGALLLCLVPTPELQERLAYPGGVPARELHLTLGYYGQTSDLAPGQLEQLVSCLQAAAQSCGHGPMKGHVNASARFSLHGRDALMVLVDCPGLAHLRHALLEAFERCCGLQADHRHGFMPHITLRYMQREETLGLGHLEPMEISFSDLQLWAGAQRFRARLKAELQ